MSKELTGRKVFVITASAFAVIIGVNVLLAVKAVSTFPGLEVKNGYVASQNFDRERAAQEALGWTTALGYEGGILRLTITDRDGAPVEAQALEAIIGRATEAADDRVPAFAFDGTGYAAPVELAQGNWDLRFVATAADGTRFRQRLELHLRPEG